MKLRKLLQQAEKTNEKSQEQVNVCACVSVWCVCMSACEHVYLCNKSQHGYQCFLYPVPMQALSAVCTCVYSHSWRCIWCKWHAVNCWCHSNMHKWRDYVVHDCQNTCIRTCSIQHTCRACMNTIASSQGHVQCMGCARMNDVRALELPRSTCIVDCAGQGLTDGKCPWSRRLGPD